MEKKFDKRVEKMIRTIESGASTTMRHPERIEHWIKTMLKFNDYGYFNQLSIHLVYENPTYVKTFKAWQKLGVNVKRGEHGCKLLRPVYIQGIEKDGKFISLSRLSPKERDNIKKNKISLSKRFTGNYTTFTVFDISQTDANEEILAKIAEKDVKPNYNTVKILQDYTGSTSKDVKKLSAQVVDYVFDDEEAELEEVDFLKSATQLALLYYLGEETPYIKLKESKVYTDNKYNDFSKTIYKKIKEAVNEVTPFLNN